MLPNIATQTPEESETQKPSREKFKQCKKDEKKKEFLIDFYTSLQYD